MHHLVRYFRNTLCRIHPHQQLLWRSTRRAEYTTARTILYLLFAPSLETTENSLDGSAIFKTSCELVLLFTRPVRRLRRSRLWSCDGDNSWSSKVVERFPAQWTIRMMSTYPVIDAWQMEAVFAGKLTIWRICLQPLETEDACIWCASCEERISFTHCNISILDSHIVYEPKVQCER